jgi:hypothetical protein
MLMPMWDDFRWTVDSTGITFAGYPFAPATVFPAGAVAWQQVDDISVGPRASARVGGELLMLPGGQRDTLAGYAARNGVPVVGWHSLVWSRILDEFLDTETSEDSRQRLLSLLAADGIGPGQVAALRRRFEPAMMMYNFAVARWEWCDLDQFDLLTATHPEYTSPDNEWSRALRARYNIAPGPFCDHEQYRALYWEIMRIAMAASPASR